MRIDEEKVRLRKIATAARHDAAADGAGAGRALQDQFFAALGVILAARAGCVISAFWPVRDEIDVTGLMETLAGRGFRIALPLVAGRSRPLIFRQWAPGDPLQAAPFGLKVPPDDAPEVTPEILIVPFLAADPEGYRLGYGGGYYDRTLRALRAGGTICAVGVGFDVQIVESVPRDTDDERLDWVITDRRAIACTPPNH